MPGLASVAGEPVERAVRRRIDHEIADEPRRMTRHRDRHRVFVTRHAGDQRRPSHLMLVQLGDPPIRQHLRRARRVPFELRRQRRRGVLSVDRRPFCFASVSKKRAEKKWQWASFSMSSRQCAGPDGPAEPVDVGAGGRALTTLRRFDENSGASFMQVPRMPIDVSSAFIPTRCSSTPSPPTSG